MALRTINSPGVEIRESDQSYASRSPVGTTFLAMGFSDKGTEYIPMLVNSLSDFEMNFGTPTNEAERYFYYAAKEVLRTGSNLIAAKLPYDNDIALNYKGFGLSLDYLGPITGNPVLSAMIDMRGVSGYYPNVCQIDISDVGYVPTSAYDIIKTGNGFDSSTSSLSAYASFDFLVVNENKARFCGADSNEGVFVVVVDPLDALKIQRSLPTATDSDVISVIDGFSYPTGVVDSHFVRPLSGVYGSYSISEDISRMYPTIPFNYRDGEVVLDDNYGQRIGLVVCKTIAESNQGGKLTISYLESFVGSIQRTARDLVNGQSLYIADIVNSRSQYIKIYKNLSIPLPVADTDKTVLLWAPNTQYQLIGFEDWECVKLIDGSSIPNQLERVFDKVANVDEVRVDVVLDAGLSTMAYTCDYLSPGNNLVAYNGSYVVYYDHFIYYHTHDELIMLLMSLGFIYSPDTDVHDMINNEYEISTWRSTAETIRSFCQDNRKDCFGILDVPRDLVLEGSKKYIRNTKPENTFSNTIGPRLKYVSGLDSSYLALYVNWVRVTDDFTGKPFWLPPSCKVCGNYGYTDKIGNLWDAPAGLNRGLMDGVSDIAFNPKPNESDQIYARSINYAKWYKSDGFVVEGQKTTITNTSAFDRIGVRRMVLRLERYTQQTARYFAMEANTATTRKRLVDVLSLAFETVRNAGGLYSYQILCDQTNNTDDVIDRNEMRCSIVLWPTRTIEYVMCDFIAVKTGETDFTEAVFQAAGV